MIRRSTCVFLLAVLVLAAVGCRHTRLTVTFKVNGPDGRDFERLLGLTDAPENTIESQGDKVMIDFKKDPEMPTRLGLIGALDTMKRVNQRPSGPLFVWRRAGLEPDLLTALGLESSQGGVREFPIKLQVREGSAALKIRHSAMDALTKEPGNQICVYQIPMDESLPDAAFKETPAPSIQDLKVSPELRRRLRAALSKLNAGAEEDRGQIVAIDSELGDLTKEMFLEKNQILNIPFGTPQKLYTENVLNIAPHKEFAECYKSILAGGEAFLRDLLFPDLSGRVKDYRLDQVFF